MTQISKVNSEIEELIRQLYRILSDISVELAEKVFFDCAVEFDPTCAYAVIHYFSHHLPKELMQKIEQNNMELSVFQDKMHNHRLGLEGKQLCIKALEELINLPEEIYVFEIL